MTLYQILTSVLAKSGNNDKIAELKKHANNDLLKAYLVAMLSPRVNFFVKKYKTPLAIGSEEFTIETLNSLLSNLAERRLTGNDALAFVDATLTSLDLEGQLLVAWLLDKGMRGGIGIVMVNKAFGYELVWDSSKHYMRCSLPSDKLIAKLDWNYAVCQVKYDGAYVELGKDIGIRTRSGNTFPKGVLPFSTDDITGIIMGEIVIYKDGEKLPRTESNGIINSALQGTPIPAEYKPTVHAWDWRPQDSDCSMLYNFRLEELEEQVRPLSDYISIVETKQVFSYEEALAFASKQIQAGEEGAILKSLKMPWKSGTSKEQIKLKVECDVDLLAVELVPGDKNGKHADTFGSIRCQTSDGKLVVDVSGISDSQRQEIAANPSSVLGKIVTVTFNDILDTESSDTVSLFLPRFGNKVDGRFMVRNDKTEADDIGRVIDIFEAATGIRKAIS